MYGLLDTDLSYIQAAFSRFPKISKAILFGSRALGTFKRGSDVDIAILGDYPLNETVLRLAGLLNEELPLPYYFDILDYSIIQNAALKKHIEDCGIAIFEH